MENFMHAFFTIDKEHKGYITVSDMDDYMQKNNFDEGFTKRWLGTFKADEEGRITLENFYTRLGLKQKKAMELRDKYLERQRTLELERHQGGDGQADGHGDSHGHGHGDGDGDGEGVEEDFEMETSHGVESGNPDMMGDDEDGENDGEYGNGTDGGGAGGVGGKGGRRGRSKYDEDDDKYSKMPAGAEVIYTDMTEADKIRTANISVEECEKTDGASMEAIDAIRARLDRKWGKHWHVIIGRNQYSLYCSHSPNTSLQFKVKSTFYLIWQTDAN